MSGAGQCLHLLFSRCRRIHGRGDFAPDRRSVFDRASSGFAQPVSFGLVLPQGDRFGQAVSPADRAPGSGIGIPEVDVAHVARVVAKIEGLQPVAPGDRWAEPGIEIVDGEKADALR